MGMGVSIKPSDAVKGGFLLIDDEDVVIVGSHICMFDYQGTQPAVPVHEIIFKRENVDDGDQGEEVHENYSIGNASQWAPSEDGKEIIPIGKAKGLNDNCKFMIFMSNLVNAGFPEDRLGNDVSAIINIRCHVNRIAGPKVKDKKTGEDRKESTVLVVTKIHQLPWEEDKGGNKGKGKGKGKAAGTGTSTTTPAGTGEDDEVNQLATAFVLDLLSNNPNGVRKADLPRLAFSHESLKPDKGVATPTRNKIFMLVNTDSWLTSVPLWRYGTETQGMVLPLA